MQNLNLTIKIKWRWFLIAETDQDKSIANLFRERLEAFDMEGKLVFKDKVTDEVIHIDFDTPQAIEENKNLPKNNEKNIKIKIENDAKMDLDEKEKPEVEQKEDMEKEEEKEETDMKTTKKGAAPEYESEEKKKLLEEDENEMKPKKKSDMALADVISTNNDLRAENEALKTQINDMLPIVNRMKKEYETKDVQDFNDLQETLAKEPYNVPKETMEGKDLVWLKDKKDFLDGLPFVKDFIEKQPISHEDVPRFMDFETGDMDPVEAVFNKAQNKFKIATDFGGVEEK